MGRAQKLKLIRKEKEAVQMEKEFSKKSRSSQTVVGILIIAVMVVAVVMSNKSPQPTEKTTTPPASTSNEPNQLATIVTERGNIVVELYRADAPKTVDNFIQLSKKGYYNDLIFHRVIKDFVIQTGDPFCTDGKDETSCGTGGESIFGSKFNDEINGRKIEAGTLAMANSGPNTNGSQFFIVTESAQPSLDGKYTVFGKVLSGVEVVKSIASSEVDQNDRPKIDIKIQRVDVAEK